MYFKPLLSLILMMSVLSCANTIEPKKTNLEPLKTQPLSIKAAAKAHKPKWWMPRHKAKLVIKQQMPTVDLVFLGDSITHAFDHKGKAVWQQYYAPLNALNIGFSGDRTEHVLWRLQHGAIDNIEPKLLVLMIGTNNTGQRQDSPEDTALGIKTILNEIHTRLPNTKVLLLAIFPRGATPDDPLRKINDNINNIIQHYHDGERVHYLDINHIFLDQNAYLSRDVMKDLLHPNPEQYEKWAQTIEPEVTRLMVLPLVTKVDPNAMR